MFAKLSSLISLRRERVVYDNYKLFNQGFTVKWLVQSFKKFYGRHSEEFTNYDTSRIAMMRDAVSYYDLYGVFIFP